MSDSNRKIIPILPELFEAICDRIETTEYGLLSICKDFGIAYERFLALIKSDMTYEIRYAQAKERQIEALVEQITDLNQQCLNEIRTIADPKRCNAIQNAYKEQIRHIEWVASKLKAKKYGDRIDVTTNNESINRSIEITPIPSVNNNTQSKDNQLNR